ncbi:MAG: tetraacyldisaccharide 4'-kinase [Xanthomonadales bacterium]|jgi:tetraacyldisaccharide 4'-kinase|nr:tetraacyldisaccharide 4'-kinase [Xanthomonadales bacterium]
MTLTPERRARLTSWLEQRWYGRVRVPWYLLLLSGLYRIVAGLRRLAYALGMFHRVQLPVPVLVIGNLTLGGTGKTPLTETLVRGLLQRGWRPGIVLRGYGGRERGPHVLGPTDDATRVGDEALLLARSTRVPVAVGADRAAAALQLIEQTGVDLIVADDGLQHLRLARDVEVLVIDGRRRFGNRRVLPAGPLREPIGRLKSLPIRVVNGGNPEEGEVPMRVEPVALRELASGQRRTPESLRGQRAHAVAGIGDPERFFLTLDELGIKIQRHPFPDHHAFRAEDLAFGDAHPVIVTEKDAVKLAGLTLPPQLLVLEVRIGVPKALIDRIDAALRQARHP